MVSMTLTPFRGNHARFYPFTGHLGHTEVVVQGVLRTELEEDRKPIKASRVVVRMRCYETENVGGKVKRKKMHLLYERESEVPVWVKSDHQEFADLGHHVHPFRIVIPPDNTGVSTTTYKSYRAWWQLEAIIYHKASSIHGSRKLVTFQMPLTRHNLSPSPLPSLSWSSALASFPLSTSPQALARLLQYDVTLISTASPGPDEGLEFAVHLRRVDPNLSVRKVSLSLERQLVIDPSHPSPNASDEDGELFLDIKADRDDSSPPSGIVLPAHEESYLPTPGPGRASSRVLSSVFKRSASQGRSPLPSPSYTSTTDPGSYFAALPTPAASTSGSNNSTPTSFTSTSSSRHVEKVTLLQVDAENVPWNGETRMKLPVPRDRSAYRYSIGETMRTRYVDVSFAVAIKIQLRHRNGSHETVELEPKSVRILGSTLEDREKARALYGRVIAVSDAEVRVCDTTGMGHLILSSSSASRPSSRRPSPPSSSLGARRASNFTLTVNTDQPPTAAPPLPSPTATAGPMDSKRRNSWFEPRSLSVRRRSEQSDAPVGAPAKSRARFGASPSPPSAAPMSLSPSNEGFAPSHGSGYVSSGLSRPPLGNSYSPATPTSPEFLITPTPSTFADAVARADHEQERTGLFPLATPPSHLVGHAASDPSSSRVSRRSIGPTHRSNQRDGSYPYSFSNRPRSAGALSIISQRSTISSQGSIRSFASGSSASTGFQRETSAPLPSSSCSTLMLLLNEEELPSLSLEPTIRGTRIEKEQASQRLPADENTDYVSGVLPIPFLESPEPSSVSLPLDEPEAFPFSALPDEQAPPSPYLAGGEDEDEYLSSAPPTPDLGDAPPSPAIDFQAFSLAARQPSTSSPFAAAESPRLSTDVDPATRAEIAPWSVEDVSPLDVAPGKYDSPRRSIRPPVASAGTTTSWNSSAWTPPRSDSMARANSSGKLGAAEHPTEGGPRRKSSAGFGLFGRDDESPGKEGGRWGFLRRGSLRSFDK